MNRPEQPTDPRAGLDGGASAGGRGPKDASADVFRSRRVEAAARARADEPGEDAAADGTAADGGRAEGVRLDGPLDGPRDGPREAPRDGSRDGRALTDPANRARMMKLGEILVSKDLLTTNAIERVLSMQRKTAMRFGEIAIGMGLVRESDVEEALSVQFGYSSASATALALPSKVTAAIQPNSPYAEALRGLRSQLMMRWFDGTRGKTSLAVTSVNRGDGKSFTVTNLGVAFAQIGEDTLIIDADLRFPTQHLNFGLDNPMGLSGVLSGRAGLEEIVALPTIPKLSVLPSGPKPPNPQELLGRDAFPDLLTLLSTRFDVILIDTSSARESSDALVIAQRARGALIVGRKDRTKASDIAQLATIIGNAGTTLLGATLNEY